MVLIAVARQGGEPVACAQGCLPSGSGLSAGMLFVRGGLARRATEFEEPITKQRITLLLPENALHLEGDGRAYGAFLAFPEGHDRYL